MKTTQAVRSRRAMRFVATFSIVILAQLASGAAAFAGDLAANRQRLLADLAARKGVATPCDLWASWPTANRRVFLTITHRLSLYHLNRTDYANQVAAPDYAVGGDMLSHIQNLYAVRGNETHEGIKDSRMFMGMDRDLWIAMVLANKVGHDLSSPRPAGWAELQSDSPADYVRDQHDPGTVHSPFNCENETKGGPGDDPGSPTGQMQFFKPQGGSCQQFASSPQLDGFGNWESSGAGVGIDRADYNSDPYMLEMDQDYATFLHPSDPSVPEYWDMYVSHYGDPDSGWEPTCEAALCSGPATFVYNGALDQNQSATHPINLQPCETVVVEMTGSASWHPSGNAFMSIHIRNAAQQSLLENNFLCGQSCSTVTGPLPGTRGTEGLSKDVVIFAGIFNWFGVPPATYTLTVRKGARPGYNKGGTDFSNATPIDLGVTQYGALSWLEVGEFYKFHLEPGQSIHLTGEASGPLYPTWFSGSFFSITLYDINQTELQSLAYMVAPKMGTAVFPGPGAYTTVFTNPGPGTDFYLKANSRYEYTHDFKFTVQNGTGQP